MNTRRNRAASFVAMHDSGMTYQQIGDEHGISRERVRQVIREEFGDSVCQNGALHNRIMLRDIRDGESVTGVSERLGVSTATALYWARKKGTKLTRKNTVDKDKLGRYNEYADMGYTYSMAAQKEGVPQPNVSAFCKKHGIKLRDGRTK